MAVELEIPKQPLKALKTAIEGKSQLIDTILINDKYHCLHLADLGFNARIIRNFEKSEIRGMLGYAYEFMKEMKEVEPISMIAKNQDFDVERQTYMTVIANARKYGTGAEVNPQGNLSDGKFEICVIKEMSWLRMLDLFFEFGEKDHELIERWQLKEVRIRALKEVPFQIDGEFMGDLKEIKAQINPESLYVIK